MWANLFSTANNSRMKSYFFIHYLCLLVILHSEELYMFIVSTYRQPWEQTGEVISWLWIKVTVYTTHLSVFTVTMNHNTSEPLKNKRHRFKVPFDLRKVSYWSPSFNGLLPTYITIPSDFHIRGARFDHLLPWVLDKQASSCKNISIDAVQILSKYTQF